MKRQFGRVYIDDPRDQKYLLTRKRKSTVQVKYWSDGAWFGDQGVLPECVGFAWSHWLSNAPISQWINPSGLYRICKFFDEWQGEQYDGTSVRAGASVLKDLGFITEYRWTFDVETLAWQVANEGPCVVGTNWYRGMSEPEAKGFVQPTGRLEGGHAWLVNGVNFRNGTLRLKNSWGRSWGRSGRAFIEFEAMQALLQQDGEVCRAIETHPKAA